MPESTVFGTVTVTSVPGTYALGSVQVVPPPAAFEPGIFEPGIFEDSALRPWEALGTVTIDGSVSLAARPRGVRQEAGIEVAVGNTFVPLSELCGGLFAERDIHRTMQAWGFQLPVPRDGIGYFGSPFDRVGPAVGKQDIDIYGVYRTSTGVHRYPLIRYGLCDSSGRTSSDGHLETFEGTDANGRMDRKTVTLVIPAGHGLPADGVVRRLFALAGETRFRLEPCARMDKEVPAVDANPVGLSAEIMESKSRALLRDRDGYLINPRLGARNGRPIQAVIEEHDLIKGSIQLRSPGDVVTEVTLTGTQQVTRTAEEQCGHETSPTEVTVKSLYLPWLASYSQSGACTLTPLAPPAGGPTDQPVTITRNIVEKRCGVVLSETVEVWTWKHVEAARYQFTSGVRSCRVVYVGADGSTNGSEPAFVEMSEKWRLISRVIKRHYYNQVGYGEGPLGIPGVDPWAGAFSVDGGTFIDGVEVDPPPRRGFRLGSITDSYGWYQVRRALKEAIPATPWEEIDVSDGLILGNGEGVVSAIESFMQVGREIEVVAATDDGYLESISLYRYGFGRRPGNLFQWSDGSESADEFETFRPAGSEISTYSMPRGNESTHSYTISRFDAEGRPLPSESGTREGAPPPVDRIPAEGVAAFDPGLFDTPEEAEAARTARPTESQQIKVKVSAAELLLTHEARAVKTSSQWAENVEELVDQATQIILQSAAHDVTFATPVNFQLAEGHWIRLRYRPLGIDHDVEVQSVRYSNDGYRTPCVSEFVGKIYPELAEAA